jgi:lipid-A-disaccharide synthase
VNLLLSAGEASGDLYGSRLLRALSARVSPLTAFGMGGARLAAEGLERVARSEELSVMGFSEILGKLPAVFRALSALRRGAAARGPNAAVLIDFPDFHAALSRRLQRDGIPLIYYVSPQVWAWRPARARVIAHRARRILTLFSFEADIYRRLGGDAIWTGHPIVDEVREGLSLAAPAPEKARPRLVLLPGSRRGEVIRHWPPMRDAAARLAQKRGVEAFAVRAPGIADGEYPGASEAGVVLTSSGIHPLLASADVALVASGTATLEAALCGAPMVVVYRTSSANLAIAKMLVNVPWGISLVNIVAQDRVVPELLQEEVNSDRLEREAETLLESSSRREQMKRALERVAAGLGPPGASERAAEAVIEAVSGKARSAERAATR